MQARIEVRALATAIRDYRPADLYADDEARFRWFQLCNVAALTVYGNDRDAMKGFLDLCDMLDLNFPVCDSRLTFTAWKKLTTSRTNDR